MKHKSKIFILIIASLFLFTSCASAGGPKYKDHDLKKTGQIVSIPDKYLKDDTDLTKENTKREEKQEGQERIICTSVALCTIADKLDLNLVGRPVTHLGQMPKRYENTKMIGLPMNPDMEVIYQLKPTAVYAPDSLKTWLSEGFEKHKLPIEFVNLRSVDSLYKVLDELGTKYKKDSEREKALKEYQDFMAKYNANKPHNKIKVLVLMGLPGSYIVATPNSYVGSLVAMSGAENVFPAKNGEEFLNVGVEEMLKQKPDIILRTAHAMPDTVLEMFKKEFAENPIWKHFDAVKQNKVYDLNPVHFGMSANFYYQEGLNELQEIYKNAGYSN